MFAVKYEVGFYMPEDGILHSHRRKNPQIFHPHILLAWVELKVCMMLGYDNGFSIKKKQTNSVALSPRANYTD
jgi:hypothetical protein